MSKVAVVGGAGYVGSFSSHALRDAGEEVVVIDDFSSGHKGAVEGFSTLEIDIVNQGEKLLEVFQKERFEKVLHFAALIQMSESMEKPGLYFRHNVLGSLNLLEACRKTDVRAFVFSSTAGVYGNPEKLPIPEDHPKNPTNPYGESKVMVEKMLRWYWEIYRLPSVSIRYFNAAGAALDGSSGEDHPEESHLIPNIIKSILNSGKITIFGGDYPTRDGTCIRDYIHVLDLTDAHIRALEYIEENPGAEFFNAGTGQGHTNLEVVKMIEEVSGKKVNYEIGEKRPGDATELVADPQLAEKVLGWEPTHSDLRTIIESAWAWHSGHPHGFEM